MRAKIEDTLIRFRLVVMVAVHLVAFTLACLLAFLVRLDFDATRVFDEYGDSIVWCLPIFVSTKLAAFVLFRQLSGWWRYVSLNDLVSTVKATLLATLVGTTLVLLLDVAQPPRSVFLLDNMLAIILLSTMRVSIRMFRERIVRLPQADADSIRTLIVGTGTSAESLIRETARSPELKTNVIGIVDSDSRLVGTRLNGCKVLGVLEEIPRLATEHGIGQVIIALDDSRKDHIREVVTLCAGADIKHRVLPTTDAILQGTVSFSNLREVDLQDLLGRPPVRLENDEIAELISGNTVLITGAGGSIGSELCRQVARFGPHQLVLFEQAENPLFHLERELTRSFPDINLRPVIGDIYDLRRVKQVMRHTKPTVVLHAAAHKHVPLMEISPSEAIKNNIIGTKSIIRASQATGVDICVLISTDKAVNPTSVMGATKRCAEMLMQTLVEESNTRLCAVRFGNVLGSNGSVIPIFKKQIAEGGPVTVTHPEMQRYFMTIPEATQLVLQAASFAKGGDIFVLDMGEPVLILDVARDLIRLSGLEPDLDIKINFSGIRPGEKLFEELSSDRETTSNTRHPRIFRSQIHPPDKETVLEAAERLLEIAKLGPPSAHIREALFEILERLENRESLAEVRSVADKVISISAANKPRR